MKTKTTHRPLILLVMAAILMIGCDEDQRVAQVAEQAAERQAQQNTEMAQLNREVAEGTKQLVAADAAARKEIITVHHEIQAERVAMNEGFDALEDERKQIAQQRRTESIMVPAAKAIGVALVVAVVIGFCCLLLFGLSSNDSSDAELNELLINDVVREEPRLIGGPRSPSTDRLLSDDSDPPLLGAADQPPHETNKEGDET